jgi:hypothetical protein
MHMDGYVSKSLFAKIYGCGLSYVTKLKDLKKLVLSDDGKLVNVEASLRLIESTGDPSKQGVRERWTAYRAGRSLDDAAAGPLLNPLLAIDVAPVGGARKAPAAESAYHQARTEKEQMDVQLKRIELRKLQGQIAEIGPILKAIQDTHIAARSALLQLPDRLAQMLAPETDPLKVHEMLRLECERVCEVMVREIQRLREQATVEVDA